MTRATDLTDFERQLVDMAGSLLRAGLTSPDCIRAVAGDTPGREVIVRLATAIAAKQGPAPATLTDRRLILHAGAELLAAGWSTPDLLNTGLIAPEITDREGVLYAIRRIATQRRQAAAEPRPLLDWEVRATPPPARPTAAPEPIAARLDVERSRRASGLPSGATVACFNGQHDWHGTDERGRPTCTACGLTRVTTP